MEPNRRIRGAGPRRLSRLYLCDGPGDDQWGLLGVGQHALGGVEEAEVGGTVDDDALDGHAEALVETLDTIGLHDLLDAVTHAIELATGAGLGHVGGQPVGGMSQR